MPQVQALPFHRPLLWLSCAVVLLAAGVQHAQASATPGQPAPDFKAVDIQGKPQNLADLKGKYVVLEWFNSECPFVRKHYVSGNLPTLQKKYTDKGVVWLAVNSTNPSHGDYRDAKASQTILRDWKGVPSALLLDSDGSIGRAYGAKTTPHMYVIDPKGTLVYAGGIDDKRSTNPEDVKTARNYVAAALDEALAGKPVTTASATPYGCSVKY